MSATGRRIDVTGTVQGVGFRPFVARLARDLGLEGRVRNGAAGVTIEVFGAPDELASFTARVAAGGPPAAEIAQLTWQPIPPEPPGGFVIEESDPGGARRISIPPDLGTCPRCAAEIADRGDRRHGYPFTNCTDCGPRFTIATDVPYDRAATTMAAFRMCPACRREYETVTDRRFHAEPNACPVCGPRLRALFPDGTVHPGRDPIRLAVRLLAAGLVVAVKGLGGWHLACDATSSPAVRRLRRAKRREEKPFAVMVRDLDAARRIAHVDAEAARLLGAAERPIVLVPLRDGAPIVPEVAPDTPLVGLMLPYTPLHHLLLGGAGRPLVLTSGNRTDEPIAVRDEEARTRLAGIADLFLGHDREIATRCDDSVAQLVAGRPAVIRRSRGYVPAPIRLARPVARPVLAVGGDLKNTFCLAAGDCAYLGPHIGDLEHPDALAALEETVARLQRLLDVEPEVVAHDLHPGYFSTAWARRRPAARTVAVQHHHAHVAAVMAEHGLAGPVLGVAYDGTGFGGDGTAWGGELLLASYAGFERLVTFQPLPLAGGDLAVRQVWRTALAAVDEAFAGAPPLDRLPLFRAVPEREVNLVRRMIAEGLNSPPAHGVGRWFDALGALILGAREARHEGQVAVRWNLVADPGEHGRYAYALDLAAEPWRVDLRPTVRRAVEEHLAGVPAGIISARFHRTLVAATADVVRLAARRHGRLPVVLSGGCFHNVRLAEGLLAALGDLDVRLPSRVPAGDGGLALGQALVADAIVKGDASCA